MNELVEKTACRKTPLETADIAHSLNYQSSSTNDLENRIEVTALRSMQSIIHNSPQVQQLKEYQTIADQSFINSTTNNTGLPNNLKSGIENLSGYSMSDVKVHYNSSKPAQLNAHAYAQGSQIHIASGQEKHLPHEAWHVVQQKQGRVLPTKQLKGKTAINDEPHLEKEADIMGMKALQLSSNHPIIGSDHAITSSFISQNTAQRVLKVKGKIQLAKDRNLEQPIQLLYGDEGVELLNDLIKNTDTYEFVNTNELQEAIGAQIILNKSDLTPDETTTDLLKQSKKVDQTKLLPIPKQGALSMAACYLLAERYRRPFFGRADDVISWSQNAIIQTTQQRGDKSHVLAAMSVDPTLQLILCFDGNFNMVAEGDGILESYAPVIDRVCIYHGSPNRINNSDNIRNLTFSTATLKRQAIHDPLETREKVKLAMTGTMDEKSMELYEKWSTELGFVRSYKNKYVIVSHRDSGHRVPEGRTPSHPELDTGEGGFIDMIKCVDHLGFIPVPMGASKIIFRGKANMINWWERTPKGLKELGKTKGQIEYGMIRYLAEQYGVRLLAMRSGNTDAMAFAGMETIFIDMATEGLDETEMSKAKLTGKEHAAHNRSWRRAAMLETILPGVFHQVFITHPRNDKTFPNQDVDWDGRFHDEDLKHLIESLEFYFGNAGAQIYHRTDRDSKSPVHSNNTKDYNKIIEARNPVIDRKKGYESIELFVNEIEAERKSQQDSPMNRLNEIVLLLKNIETRLLILSHDLDRLKQELETLRKNAEKLSNL